MSDEQLKQRAQEYVDEVWEDIVHDIDYLVQVESVEDKDHAEPGKPWGPAPYEALSRGLKVASKLGLDAHDVDGYLGYADLPGESQKYLATIGHTDVVPLGTGWDFDPLHVTRKDGYLIGRGVLDDKGPTVLSLYAAHFFAREVQRTGHKLPYTLRAIIGNNEETNMGDVEYYLAHYPEPEFLFTPDADFPLICGEKGRVGMSITSGELGSDARITDFEGGTVSNAIPGVASVTVRADAGQLPQQPGTIEVVPAGDGLAKVVAHGKGGHASMPEGTVNAIGLLVDYLLQQGLCNAAERQYLELLQRVFASTDGTSLGIDATDDLFDPLTSIGGTIRMRDGRLVQTMDVRYPKSTTGEAIARKVGEAAGAAGASLHVDSDMVPFYTSPDSPQIQTLVSTYNELTGDHAHAFTIGGGTYARHFKRAAAFGPHDSRQQMPDWVGPEHGPNEGVAEAQLKLALRIYIVSIARLMRLEY
ncbi:MAG: Sapep family Mn(2+)-dependent dipeptidase [Atopobiaceae bacterium]